MEEQMKQMLVYLQGWQGFVINFIVPCIPLFEISKPILKHIFLPLLKDRQQLESI